MNQSNKKQLFILFCVLVVCALGIAAYKHRFVPTSPSVTKEWSAYVNEQKGFKLLYPPEFTVIESQDFGPLGSGTSFLFPGSFMNGTNLSSDSRIHIETKENVAECNAGTFLSLDPQVSHILPTVTKNRYIFTKATTHEAGAGNFYEQTVYATLQDGTCYGITLYLRSGNVGAYDPGTVVEFDRKNIETILEAIIDSFTLFGKKGIYIPQSSSNSQMPQIINYKDIDTSSYTPYTYRKNNFSIKIPPGWDIVTTDSAISLPKGTHDAYFGIQKKGTTCMFAYAQTNQYELSFYQQTAFGFRVFPPTDQFDPSWYVRKDQLPPTFAFDQSRKQSFPGEMLLQYYRSPQGYESAVQNVFLVYDTSGSVVAPDCAREAMNILATVELVYEPIVLAPYSQGMLIFAYNYNKAELFFKDAADGIIKSISGTVADDVPPPTVYNNLIYFVDESKNLSVLDIFSGSRTMRIPGIERTEREVINEFYIYQDKLYYLVGADCTNYREGCDLSLFEYDMKTEKSVLLAQHMTSRQIAGYNSNLNSLVLYYSEGDGGCMWGSVELYNMKTRAVKSIPNLGGCNDEPGIAYLNSFKNQSNSQSVTRSVPSLRIEQGKILLSSSTEPTPFSQRNIRFVVQ